MKMIDDQRWWGLPDPDSQAEFYADVPAKRALAWVIDSVLVGTVTLLMLPLTAFLALFFLPLFFLTIGFVYRWVTVRSGGATWGMRLLGLEMRNARGERPDSFTTMAHSAIFSAACFMILPLLLSVAMVLVTRRRQNLPDLVLGTAAINRVAN